MKPQNSISLPKSDQTFGLDPMYRRCLILAMSGMSAIPVVFYLVVRWLDLTDEVNTHPVWILMLFIIPLGFFRRYRIRLNEVGLSQNRLWGWQTFSWQDFEEGKILKRDEDKLLHTEKPIGFRTICIGYLSPEDAKAVRMKINDYFELQKMDDLPETIFIPIKSNAPGSKIKRWSCNAEGIKDPVNDILCPWDEIQAAWFLRTDPKQLPSRKILIQTPDNVFSVVNPQNPLVNAFLQRHIPRNRIELTWPDEYSKHPTFLDFEHRHLQH
ncbi:MAG: hypothetical protein JJU29_10925 [Verrucomicrobia bacterium]|nr:hypothetical protein [Verrucomicrobiota bacterium]MCH8510015.1 hypothetical protein [Kiritimatiellia bacterium]